jgi:hypothetical protein
MPKSVIARRKLEKPRELTLSGFFTFKAPSPPSVLCEEGEGWGEALNGTWHKPKKTAAGVVVQARVNTDKMR